MFRYLAAVLVGIGVGLLMILALEGRQARPVEQDPRASLAPRDVTVKVLLPHAQARLRRNGTEIPGEGPERTLAFTGVVPSTRVVLEAEWRPNSYTRHQRRMLFAPASAGDVVDLRQPDSARPDRIEVKLEVLMPQADAELRVAGVDIRGEGLRREVTAIVSEREPLVEALWKLNEYTKMKRANKPRPGDGALLVDLSKPDPASPDKIEVEFIPTPDEVVAEMCRLARVGPKDIVYDLGCGDGRMVLKAVTDFNAKLGVGVDIDANLIKACRQSARDKGVADRVEFRQGDVLDIKDLSRATVVLLYMGDDINLRLRPILQKTLRPGARIVSHAFKMGDWEPTRKIIVDSEEWGKCTVYLWIIPER